MSSLILHLCEYRLHLLTHDLDCRLELLVLDLQLRHLLTGRSLISELLASLYHLNRPSAKGATNLLVLLVAALVGQRRVLRLEERLARLLDDVAVFQSVSRDW